MSLYGVYQSEQEGFGKFFMNGKVFIRGKIGCEKRIGFFLRLRL